ncbi:MAG: hypothetical protein AAB944_01600 [Patescibacteria group bacterium]
MRLHGFQENHYSYQSDYNRDYLVAHHIVAHHEFPLTGPDGEFGTAGNSPAYFYFLALPLLIKDDIVFLGLFNVFLQMCALVFLYMIGRAMFGQSAGLTATALFGFSTFAVNQSNFIWQPWIMQPFFLLSLYILHQAYVRQKYNFILISIAIFFFSATLHQSVYAILPIYIYAIILVLRNQQKTPFTFLYTLVISVSFFLVLHAPLFYYLMKDIHAFPSFTGSSRAFLSVNFLELWEHAYTRGTIFWNYLYSGKETIEGSPLPAIIFATLFFITVIMRLMSCICDKGKKIYILLLSAAVLQFFIVIVVVSVPPMIPFPVRYFTPLFGIVILSMAGVLQELIGDKGRLLLVKITAVIFITLALSHNLPERLTLAMRAVILRPISFLLPQYVAPPFITAIAQEVAFIKRQETRSDIHFFDVRMYRFGREDPYSNEILWTPLERNFAAPLVALRNDAQRDYKPIGSTHDYLFIYCGHVIDEKNECLIPFFAEFPNYYIEKVIYINPIIYLAKKSLAK